MATRISAAIILWSFQPSTMGAVPVFYSIAVLDLRIVKWATKGYWSGQRLVVTQNVWRER
jgi:hypothetical protein